jgi:bacterioferritin-associated ferredoxin
VIVCHCKVVSDRAIRREVDHGAETAAEIAARCGAGARCGLCRPTIDALVAVHNVREPARPAA